MHGLSSLVTFQGNHVLTFIPLSIPGRIMGFSLLLSCSSWQRLIVAVMLVGLCAQRVLARGSGYKYCTSPNVADVFVL